jgi:hypothetical protein
MPALFFPTTDVLRLALTSGLVPGGAGPGPGRAAFDPAGHLWLEPDELPSREAVTALARLGVVALGSPGVVTAPVRSWAELLPLRPGSPERDGPVLFDVPDHRLAAFVARLRRAGPVGVRLLPEPFVGRAWVTAPAPPASVFLLADEPSEISAYHEQAPGVWVVLGRQHPLPTHLHVPDRTVLLCRPDREIAAAHGPVPHPVDEELPLRARPIALQPDAPAPRIDVPFRLVRADGAFDETLWVLTPDEFAGLEHFAHTSDERLLRQFESATVRAGGESRVLVRRADPEDRAAVLPIAARGYQPHPQLPTLFVPVGRALRPVIRNHELARELGTSADLVVWVESTADGIAVHSVAGSAFTPLRERVEYEVPPRVGVRALAPPDEMFPFDRFAVVVDTTIELDPEPVPTPVEAKPARPDPAHDSGLVAKAVTRMLHWMRRPRERADRPVPPPVPAAPTTPPAPVPPGRRPDRVERKLTSADALLHGEDRAARCRKLETRVLADFPRLGTDARAALWAELASVYGATGHALDSAVCWTNALWDCGTPPEGWLEQWALAECRAAKRTDRGADLDRWLSEPGRPGTGRVVAALAAYFGFQPVVPAGFVAALPRVLAVLEQHFDDLPVRGAWLARLAVARSCDGDVLGLARWRDRLIHRLRDRGPGLDLDEPSFLRFRGTATGARFKTAREWLVRVQKPVLDWVAKHAEHGTGLQSVGLDGEADATAAYARLLLAWGLGALGERARSRDWAARARKALASAAGPRADPAAHAFLGDLFLHRIKDAHEGHTPKPGLAADLQARLEQLPEFARYSVDRLREHCRILHPSGTVRAYRGRELREFWGHDQLAERLTVLGGRTDPAQLNDEARAFLAVAAEQPTTATVPRITLALLEVAPVLDPALGEAVLALVPTALDWTEAWVQAGRWTDEERSARTARFQARMIELAFAIAPAGMTEHLLRHLTRGVSAGALVSAVTAAAPRVFRAARRFGLAAAAEPLMVVLDPAHGEWPGQPVTAERVGLAIGWFASGDEEAGHRVLNAARDALFATPPPEERRRTDVALAYAEALGFAPGSIALGRLEELFQRLPRVTTHASSNCYFTLHPLRLIDTVVRSVVTDEFTLGAAVRAWLDEDEFLIRRRIHRDMAALLRERDAE